MELAAPRPHRFQQFGGTGQVAAAYMVAELLADAYMAAGHPYFRVVPYPRVVSVCTSAAGQCHQQHFPRLAGSLNHHHTFPDHQRYRNQDIALAGNHKLVMAGSPLREAPENQHMAVSRGLLREAERAALLSWEWECIELEADQTAA